MANENMQAKSEMEQQVEMVERIGGMLGRGLAFLVHAGVEVGIHTRDTFVKIAESKPEVAQALIKAYETVATASINAETKIAELQSALATNFMDGCFRLAEKVVEKVDVNQLVSHGIQHDLVIQQARMKEAEAELIKAQAKAKVAETEAAARLLEAQNDAKREDRYERKEREARVN